MIKKEHGELWFETYAEASAYCSEHNIYFGDIETTIAPCLNSGFQTWYIIDTFKLLH